MFLCQIPDETWSTALSQVSFRYLDEHSKFYQQAVDRKSLDCDFIGYTAATAPNVHGCLQVPFTLTLGATMLRWALIFFVVAIIAAVFGFGGVAGEAAWIGKVLLFIFLILAVVSLIMGRRGSSIN
jgi:uncharacterized membrane protein YtjA (UPF0391 family)